MDIWQEIRKDAERGAERLVSEYGDRIYAAATLLCRNADDAEDLTFRTFDQAVKKIRHFRPTGDFFSWLYKILLNFYRMERRKHEPDIVLMGAPQDLPTVSTVSPDGATAEVKEAIGRLPPVLRETVLLKYFRGLSIEEIAKSLSLPAGTVKSRLFTARKILEEAFGAGRKPAARASRGNAAEDKAHSTSHQRPTYGQGTEQ